METELSQLPQYCHDNIAFVIETLVVLIESSSVDCDRESRSCYEDRTKQKAEVFKNEKNSESAKQLP